MGKKDKNSVEFKAVMPLEQLKSYLMDLMDGLEEGCVSIQSGDQALALRPMNTVKVEIEAKEKKDKSKISIELSWKTEMEAKGDPSALKIGAVATVPPVENCASEEQAVSEDDAPEQEEVVETEKDEDDRMEEIRHGE